MTDDKGPRGPAWYDVHIALGVLERTYDLKAEFVIGRQIATKKSDQGLSVQLLLERKQSGTKLGHSPVFWSMWPHVDHKTMPGLMLKMIHKATDAMEKENEEPQRIAPLALPF